MDFLIQHNSLPLQLCLKSHVKHIFIYHRGNYLAGIFLYVDDIILIASSDSIRQSIMTKLDSKFSMKDIGPLSYFIRVFVTRHT